MAFAKRAADGEIAAKCGILNGLMRAKRKATSSNCRDLHPLSWKRIYLYAE